VTDASSQNTMSIADDVDASSPEVMLTFYRRLYPFKSIFNWLNHEHTPTRLFTHREFSFTLQGDVYLRYNSFNSAEDLKKQVCSLNPTRFEIGPVYSVRVCVLIDAFIDSFMTQHIFSASHGIRRQREQALLLPSNVNSSSTSI
jgi:hypothetical protein